MASTTKQQNYRRLMKEAKVKSSSQPKKIDHPLARYNALEQLSCIVCQQTIKSELLWSTHLKSRRHKETMTELKNRKEVLLQQQKVPVSSSDRGGGGEGSGERDDETERASSPPPTVAPPPPPPPQLNSVLKKSKREAGSSSEDGEPPPTKKHKVTFSDVVEVQITTVEKPRNVEDVNIPAAEKSSLPADFFDPGVSKRFGEDGDSDSGDEGRSGETAKADASSKPLPNDRGTKAPENSQLDSKSERSQESAIPEGFFDDPKVDAKIRKVEYKDKMEEEWERFQKTIQKENDVSEAIRFEDEEEAQGERDFSEIQEQVECFQRAEALRLKQEELLERKEKEGGGGELTSGEEQRQTVAAGEGEEGEEEGSSDDELMDELEMDWRAKHS